MGYISNTSVSSFGRALILSGRSVAGKAGPEAILSASRWVLAKRGRGLGFLDDFSLRMAVSSCDRTSLSPPDWWGVPSWTWRCEGYKASHLPLPTPKVGLCEGHTESPSAPCWEKTPVSGLCAQFSGNWPVACSSLL